MKQSYNRNRAKEFYFWRTYDNQEIDLIEESPEGLSALNSSGETKKRMSLPVSQQLIRKRLSK